MAKADAVLPYQHLIESCFADKVGQAGLDRAAFDALLNEAAPAIDNLRNRQKAGDMPLLSLPGRADDLDDLDPVAARLRADFDDVVVLGTGGSSLGAQALLALAPHAVGSRLHLPDNLDGDGFADLLVRLAPDRTAVLAVSKSGGTAETIAQTLAAMTWLKGALGDGAVADRVTAIVEPGDNVLRRLAARWQMQTLDHDPNLGGRYSVLSLVGLLPAMIAGLDARAVRAGADAVLQAALTNADAPPIAGAAIAVGLQRAHGISTNVVMPYCDRLERLAAWHRQLWAESLGKDGRGLTPISSLGPVDQHSQLQLWLDGPADKSFTVIEVESRGRGPAIDLALTGDDPALSYLKSRTIGDVVAAEARATAETLAARGRPTRVMKLEKLDEKAVGALLMHFMLECIVAAHLLGVDPFDQPAVEDGKVLTRQYLAEGHS